MSIFNEFKKFALKGNMIELAIGVIIGSAFSNLVNAIVADLFMPVIGLITGGIDFSNMFWQLSGEKQNTLSAAKSAGATIAYGHFLTMLINFFIIAWILFLLVKALNQLRDNEETEKTAEPKIPEETALLKEIRDILADKNQK